MRLGLFVVVPVIVLAGAAQVQHVLWSTARIENATTTRLDHVTILVDDASLTIGSIPPRRARFVRLPKRGDAAFRVRFAAHETLHEGCSEYVEGEMYHVRVTVSGPFAIVCTTELGLVTKRPMLLEMF